MHNIFLVQTNVEVRKNKLGSKFVLELKKRWFKKSYLKKNWFKKNCWSEKFVGSGSEKNLGPENNLKQKKFGSKKILFPNIFWVRQLFRSNKNVSHFTSTIMPSTVFLYVTHLGVRILVLSDLICNTPQPNTGRKKQKKHPKISFCNFFLIKKRIFFLTLSFL